MICKFRADQVPAPRLLQSPRWLLLLALAAVAPAQAEKADRAQPIVVEADRPGTLDLQRQVVVFNGNVRIAQGTMQIQADRIEVREQAGGHRSAIALGVPGQPAGYRQRRDGLNETVEGSADRIDYDSKSGQLRLAGNATVRRLRAGVVADEITGALITWDDDAELFSVAGSDPLAPQSSGRVRAVLTPSPDSAATGPKR